MNVLHIKKVGCQDKGSGEGQRNMWQTPVFTGGEASDTFRHPPAFSQPRFIGPLFNLDRAASKMVPPAIPPIHKSLAPDKQAFSAVQGGAGRPRDEPSK
ncbi:hypothetical protein AAFF_G00191420 [Aldrovandia affinis]|uniref:Uncharacterized protein n=1 Tax=Aldrovandia affinis TaxID=143900 RepID=A0AAD7RJM0_9TELE|nr:hypothetical protein AAFF_G00191420 [Aldrovandia affinis]